jgi:hypothetical protein
MAPSVDDFNLDPNQTWYVKLSHDGGAGLVGLFNSQADAEAGTNRVAYAAFSYGTAVEITLTNDAADPEVSIFNTYLEYHLRVTFLSEDDAALFRVGPFTDLPEVRDTLLVSSAQILDRARREIDEHTHTAIERTMPLAAHYPALDVGDIVRVTDSMRSLDVSTRLTKVVTQFDAASLTDTITTVEYKDVTR